jgi:hypothetical protein
VIPQFTAVWVSLRFLSLTTRSVSASWDPTRRDTSFQDVFPSFLNSPFLQGTCTGTFNFIMLHTVHSAGINRPECLLRTTSNNVHLQMLVCEYHIAACRSVLFQASASGR